MHYFFGFSYWKHEFMKPFFKEIGAENIIFINSSLKKNYFKMALDKGLDKNSKIYIWGKKPYPLVEEFAQKNALKIFRVEDGFIRSVGLGSDLTQPYSLVIDSRGIYFDPTQESDLEYMLQNSSFDDMLIQRAKKLRSYLLEKKISKYNLYENKIVKTPKGKKVIVVPGQVEDDASIKFGAQGMTNLKLLQEVRSTNRDAYIIYKPHPDVLVGNRIGDIDETIALQYANRVITEYGIDSVLEFCDEVHTMTSLVGFEALMREKKVITYGSPFYSGWGLTIDKKLQKRRRRKLTIDELVAVVFLNYPKYISPKTLLVCKVEEMLEEMTEEKKKYDNSWLFRMKIKLRNKISRSLQLLIRTITLKEW